MDRSYIEWLRERVGRRKIFLVFGTVVLRDENGRILLQRRTDFDFWGLPGGVMELGEDIEACARRELLEETGYAADEIVLIGTVTPNPAFLDNTCYSYLALNARKVQEPALEASEDIVVEEVPLAEVAGMVKNGRITHSLVVAAFYHLERYEEVNGNR